MKQTAVEFLEKKLDDALCDTDYITWQLVCKAVREAKEMFEQQIIESGNSCAFKQRLHSDRINKMSIDELEQYDLEPSYTFGEEHYYETFKK